ncbi:hypothetical protein [Agromyces marinus]|uniref:DUF2975 domain-containing protein n=1 Tax=Agromyces marinus TaxID=1389020 RepID=A0ABN6YHR4_9MICO|nr:hypothetical protein [Agromyces marinus]UIP59504.1 hypothetical protein DSM26151_24120 [Agromyces marinus]BDZ55445.1 hypothetical protein GCM10025870_25180 [Agromyces marinus]
MAAETAPTALDRSDRVGMYLTVALAVIGAVVAVWAVVARLVEVLPGSDVPVLVPFVDETAPLPIGPNGALVEVDVAQAVVVVPDPAPATWFALIAEPIVIGLAVVAAIGLLAAFAWNLAHGRAFSRGNVRVVLWAAATIAAGWFLGSMLTTMGVNGALSAVSEYTYDGVLFGTDWLPFWGVLALGAIGAAFQIGGRLQRETEGLV